MPSQDATPVLDSSGTSTPVQQTPGNSTIIAGSGSDELYAGNGNDVLIGGCAVLENGQYVLVPGAGRDYLLGGRRQRPVDFRAGQPGAIMIAGSATRPWWPTISA